MRHARAFLFLAAVVIACKREPRPGDDCNAFTTSVRCLDAATIVVCGPHGVLVTGACKGPRGCSTTDGWVACDFTGNAEGEPCAVEPGSPGFRCAEDGVHAVGCETGKTHVATCRGPKGCDGSCDNSVWSLGDACVGGLSPRPFCDDRKEIACLGGRFAVFRSCPAGCRVHEEVKGNEYFRSVVCEVKTTATVGEACDQDHQACSVDGGAVLDCTRDGHVFAVRTRCTPPTKCALHRDPDVIRATCE